MLEFFYCARFALACLSSRCKARLDGTGGGCRRSGRVDHVNALWDAELWHRGCIYLAPAFAFLSYKSKAASAWSLLLLSVLSYMLFLSDLFPPSVLDERVRRGILAAYVLQTVISAASSYVRSHYSSELGMAKLRIQEL